MERIKNYKILIIGGVVLFIGLVGFLIINNNSKEEIISDEKPISLNTTKEVKKENFYVDVKGAVKDPGVYLVSDGDRVIDAISLAGGLKKNANTGNINLSKRLVSEMVIYVYTNNEISNGSEKISCDTTCNCETIEINNCIESSNNKSSDLVNINKASLDELLTLTGIGESKAKAIISYREENGSFKTIEDIKNVTGIGDALFLKIKGSITV